MTGAKPATVLRPTRPVVGFPAIASPGQRSHVAPQPLSSCPINPNETQCSRDRSVLVCEFPLHSEGVADAFSDARMDRNARNRHRPEREGSCACRGRRRRLRTTRRGCPLMVTRLATRTLTVCSCENDLAAKVTGVSPTESRGGATDNSFI